MKIMGLVALFTMGLLVLIAPAEATPIRWSRTPSEANIGSCGGQLVEQVVVGGSVMSSYSTLALVCMKSESQAEWVLLSNANCGDRIHEQPGQCRTRAGRPGSDQIVAMEAYAEKGSPRIHLVRADLGRHCMSVTGHGGRSDHWECASYKSANGTTLRVRGGKFQEMEYEANPMVLGHPSNIPWEFPTGFETHVLNSSVKEYTGPEPTWSGNPKYMRYGQPETDSLTTLECKGGGVIQLVVGVGNPLPPPSNKGNIFAMGRTEQADYKMRLGDGEELVFQITAESVALASLAAGQDFRIQLPNAEWVFVSGKGASKFASALRAACSKPVELRTPPSQPSSVPGVLSSPIPTFVLPEKSPAPKPSTSTLPSGTASDDRNTGWWVVLAANPDMHSRAASGGSEMDRVAAQCGTHIFDDYSSRFEGFESGKYIFTMGTRPFREKSAANEQLGLIRSCFPNARVVYGRYLSS
jgi:hypothetical protein